MRAHMHAGEKLNMILFYWCGTGDKAYLQGAGDSAAGHGRFQCGLDLGTTAAV